MTYLMTGQRRDEWSEVVAAFNTMLKQITLTQKSLAAAKEAAEQASRAKSDFLAKMSHKLRTPLQGILGFGEILHDEAEEKGLKNFSSGLTQIRNSGKNLLGLIDDILDLAKVEAGKMPVLVEPIDICDLTGEISASIFPLVDRHANRLEVRCPEDVGEMTADAKMTRQILLNFLSNAAKFTRNGQITLSVVGELKNGEEWMVFAVRDTGIGIAPEQVTTIFEEFSQAEISTFRQHGGTGLGLTISKKFCHLMGGNILVESKLGEGSTFTLCLPRHAPKRPFRTPFDLCRLRRRPDPL